MHKPAQLCPPLTLCPSRCSCSTDNFPKVLQCLNVTVLSEERCKDSYPGQIDKTMFCAGDEEGRDSCQVNTGCRSVYPEAWLPFMYFICVCTLVSRCVCGGRGTTHRGQFSSSTMWVLRIGLGPLGSAASTVTTEPPHQPSECPQIAWTVLTPRTLTFIEFTLPSTLL